MKINGKKNGPRVTLKPPPARPADLLRALFGEWALGPMGLGAHGPWGPMGLGDPWAPRGPWEDMGHVSSRWDRGIHTISYGGVPCVSAVTVVLDSRATETFFDPP